jgi:transcriptional regulator with XRE-family HTH domain
MTPSRKPKPLTANQLVAQNLRRARELRGWTQEEAAKRLEPYLGVRWSKATFSVAERSAFPNTRAREFSADNLLAFSRAFGVSVSWFFLPPEGAEALPNISCGGPELITPAELVDAALTRGTESDEAPRIRALMGRISLDAFDERIRRHAFARVEALGSASASVPNVTEHAANLRRIANALEAAEDKARELFAAAYVNEVGKEKDA